MVDEARSANDTIARANREDFDRHGVVVVHVMGAPGAGKTALLECALAALEGEFAVGVLEGDVQGRLDADRLARFRASVTQLNTEPRFAGESHLDANMVRSALSSIPLADLDLLVVENVGDLLHPADSRIGEDRRVMVSSVTEGEDKPLKYPRSFRASELVLVNKVDLLPHLEYDVDRFLDALDDVHPRVRRILTSARTGDGVEEWCAWLRELVSHRWR
jgi:hydrogenase nickel incorporation protein HypB